MSLQLQTAIETLLQPQKLPNSILRVKQGAQFSRFGAVAGWFIMMLLTFSCNCKPEKQVRSSKNRQFHEEQKEQSASTENQLNDTEKKLMRELKLCENYGTQDDCYNALYSKFIQLTADSSYRSFLYVGDGGSGGQDLRVYEKQGGKYRQTNDFFAFFDSIPGTFTKDRLDIQLSFRDYNRGYIDALFKWDGKKYKQNRITAVNTIPIDLLIALGITDKTRLTDKYPYVKERKGFDDMVYVSLSFDTLNKTKNQLILEVTSNYYYPETILKEPVRIRYSNGRYTRIVR